MEMRLNVQRLSLSMRNQKDSFLQHVPRQVIIRAHQEQLDEMAELDFKEETLMTQMDSNVSGTGQIWATDNCTLAVEALWPSEGLGRARWC